MRYVQIERPRRISPHRRPRSRPVYLQIDLTDFEPGAAEDWRRFITDRATTERDVTITGYYDTPLKDA